MNTRTIAGIVLAVAVLAPGDRARAHPPYRKALAESFGPTFAAKLNNCRTCHQGDGGAGTGRRQNAFGARLKEIKYEMREAGQKTAILLRLERIADEDADGDGVANLLELASGHFPGEATDTPTAAEVAEARRALKVRISTLPGAAPVP